MTLSLSSTSSKWDSRGGQSAAVSSTSSLYSYTCDESKDYEAHISNVRQEGAWATQAEIYATATLFQIDVSVFTWMGIEWAWN